MKKILTLCGAAMLVLLMTTGLTSCEGDKYYYDEYYQTGPVVDYDKITVNTGEWVWNSRYYRYECIKDREYVDEFTFNEDFIAVGVYMEEKNGNETYTLLRPLTYVQAYEDYDLYIGTDISWSKDYKTGTIAFYLQIPGVTREADFRREHLKTYDFKVSIIRIEAVD